MTPLTPFALSAIERQYGDNAIIQRLVATVRAAWAGKVPEPDIFHAGKTLVIQHYDGYCEVYSDPQTAVKVLCLQPWDSEEVAVKRCGPDWWRLFTPGNCVGNAYPHYMSRPNKMTWEDMHEFRDLLARDSMLEYLTKIEGVVSKFGPPPAETEEELPEALRDV